MTNEVAQADPNAQALKEMRDKERDAVCSKLKDGTYEHKALVATVMFSLRELMKTKPLVVYELTELAKDRNHVIWGKLGKDACSLGLLTRTAVESEAAAGAYQLHDSICNIILNATEGEGLQLHLVNPIAAQPPDNGEPDDDEAPQN